MDRAEFERIKRMEQEILRGRPAGGVVNGSYGQPNGLTPEQTIGFINKQSANDAEWKVVKAFYNGSWNMLERGVLGSLAMLRDNNIESLKAQGIEVGDGGKYIDMALNSDHLQPYEVKGNTQLGQLGLDLAQGAGQLAGQIAIALTPVGIVGSTVAMGASIAGNQYADLRKDGVPVDRATRAAVINAGVQAPLERVSLGNILSKLPAGSGLRQKVVQVAQNAITEGMTEYIQQYPEEITNIYAKSGGNLEELANKTLEQLPEIHRNGLYAGMIGAILGGGAGAINVAVRRNVNAAQLEAVENRVEQAKKTGITPEAYANTVNNNMPGSTVSVDGDVLLGFMQSGKADEIAQVLGVTVNEVQQAADEGLTVELAQGSYEGAAMKYADFLPTMRDHTAFEVGGFMQSDAPGQRELQKEYQSFNDTEAALQAQLDTIAESMQQAGMNAAQRTQTLALLASRARTLRPDNPASFFEEYPITFQRGADGSVGYEQSAMRRSSAKTIAEFGNEIKNNPLPSKTGFWFTTQSGDEITIPGSNYVHIQDGKHPLSDEQWQNIIENIENVEYAVTDNAKGHHTGVPVQIKIDTPIGKAGVSLEFLPNGRVLLITAAYNNDAAIDNWLKNKKSSRTLGVASYKDPNRIPGSPSLLQSIKDELGIVNKYNQSAYHGTPHSFERFDLGAIGTGEGNQAHGWGLYFAADKEIADERYRKRLTNNQYVIETDEATYYFDIEKQDWVDKKTGQPVGGMGTPLGHAVWEIGFREGNVQAALKALKGQRDALIEENDSSNAQRLDFLIRTIKLLEEKKFNYRKDNGSLFEVDIPENDVLLDEDKPINKQPLAVRKAILEYYKSRPDNYITEGITIDDLDSQKGGQFYKEVVFQMQSEGAENPQKAASELLNEYGIKGITYDGARDGRCFVVFDDKAISIINRYNQSANEGNRGSIYWNDEGRAIVQLFEAADASTFIHEATGHYFANVLAQEAAKPDAPEQIVKDFNTMLDYAGTTRERWEYLNSKPRPQLTEAEDKELVKIQETWATAAEQYILEGKAPNRELQPVFNRFKKWLLDVYKSIERFVATNEYAVPITDEVRQVFDRMLASEQQITEMEKLNGYYAKLPKTITDNLSDRYKTLLYNKMAQAHDKAVQLLTSKSLENFTAERKERIQQYREEMRPKVTEAVDNEPLYTASRQLLEDNVSESSSGIKGLINNLSADDLNRIAKITTLDKSLIGKTRQELFNIALENIQEKLNQQYEDPLGNKIYFAPGNTETIDSYALHLIAGKNKPVDEIRVQRVLGLLLAEETIKNPLAIVRQSNGRKMYLAMYKGENKMTNGLVIGVEEGQNGRVVTSTLTADKKGDKKAALREFKKRISGADEVLYIWEGLTGRPRPSSDQQASQSDAELHLSGDNIISQNANNGKNQRSIKAYVDHYYDLVNRSMDIEAKPLTEAEEMEVMTFDLTAETNGFESGDALAKAIMESPTRQQAIAQRLDDEVQKRFPDIYKERRLAEAAAQEAFYNDDTGEVLGLEEQIIEDAARKTLDQQRSAEQQRQLAQMKRQQAKVQAQGYLRSVPLREALHITKYVTAERRAAANAATALAKGDYEAALDYKHKQLLAHAMVQESINMNRRYAQNGKFLSRQRKMKKENWGNEENFMQVGALFARMGLRLRGYDERLKQQSLREWADVMQENYDNVAIADWIYNESRTFAHPLSDLTFDEYEDVVNALKNIRAVVKAQTMMQGEAKNQSVAEMKGAGMEAMDKLPTKYTPDVNKKGKAKALDVFARQLRNSDNLFEMLDNWTYGWFSKHFGEAVRRCADVEAELTMKYEDATRQAYKEWLPDKAARKAANKAVHYDELGTSVNKHTLIKLAINLGNESNAAKLCSTALNSTYREWFANSPLWVEGDAIQTKKNLLEFLGRVLTAEDWRYAQRKIDIANMFWQQMSELEYRDKGFRPPKVEAYPEIITLADGQQIVFRGGYFPLIRRRDTGSHPASQDAIPSTTGGRPGDSIKTLHTNTGHTKARDNSIYPIDLTPGGEFAVAMDTIHDIAYRETMNNFRKLMNDREFYNKLKEKLGIADMEALEEFLKKAAQPYGGSGFATLSERDTGRMMSWLRSKTVNAAIMLNFKTSLQNLGNPLLYGRVVDGFGYADVLAAYANYQKNWQGRKGFYAMRDFVYSKSVFMRERGQLPDISLRDMKDEGAELNPIEKRTIKWGTQMLTFTDELSALPVWLQAYQKKINANATEDEAVQFANTVIRRTLGSSRITDVAPIQRGGPLMKLITTFQGFFNTQYNQWNREFNIVRRAWGDKQYGTVVGRVSAFAASKFLLFNLINLALAFENPLGDDDDDGWPKIATELLHYPISLLGPVGGVANAMLNNMLDIKDYGYSMTVIEGSLDKMFKAGKLVGDIASGDKEISEAVEPVAGVAAMAAGIPNQLTKLFFNAWDILYNDMEAEPRDLFYRRPARDR